MSRFKMTLLEDLIPGIKLVRTYRLANFSSDFLSGLVVVLVLIPSAIAYADLAHCKPIAGLYASLGSMILFALFTSSRHVIAGPDAAIALMVGSTIGTLAAGNESQALVLSTWLCLLTGLLLLLGAYFKLGAAADFLAHPVMLGFMNGAAVVIIISQLGKLCGIALHEDNSLLRLLEWVKALPNTHWPTLLLGLSCIAILIVLRWRFPKVPGTVAIFALALLAGKLIDFQHYDFAVIGTVDTNIPDPVPPELSLNEIAKLAVASLGLALLIFPEGIVLGRSIASKHNENINPDRELIALGMANLAAGLLRGFAVGASQTRSLLNDSTGGRTQMVSLIAAALLIVFMYFLASWIAQLPVVAIAGILVFTGFTLIDATSIRKLRSMSLYDSRLAMLTSISVVAFGVLPGIMAGIIASLLRLLSQLSRPHDALLGRIAGQPSFHDVGDDEKAETIPGLLIYRFYGPLIFANVRYFIERIEHFIAREEFPVRQVILDARAIPEIDVSAAETIHKWLKELQARNIDFIIAKSHLPFRETASRLGLGEHVAEGKYYPQLPDAVAAFERLAPQPRN